jgi:hypothetical protein
VQAVDKEDEESVKRAVNNLVEAHRWLAPLTLTVGALLLLLKGLRVTFSDWRLTALQILPAMWIWAVMLDLKANVFHNHEFNLLYGYVALLAVIGVIGLTVATFYLNAAFATAISMDASVPGRIKEAFATARRRWAAPVTWGGVIGAALAVSMVIVPRYGKGWFALALGISLAVLMVTYVTVPARSVGLVTKGTRSRRDALTSSVISTTAGAVVCSPAYILGRIGILLLGSRLLVLGAILLAVGLALQAGASGAVKAVKMSARLIGH